MLLARYTIEYRVKRNISSEKLEEILNNLPDVDAIADKIPDNNWWGLPKNVQLKVINSDIRE